MAKDIVPSQNSEFDNQMQHFLQPQFKNHEAMEKHRKPHFASCDNIQHVTLANIHLCRVNKAFWLTMSSEATKAQLFWFLKAGIWVYEKFGGGEFSFWKCKIVYLTTECYNNPQSTVKAFQWMEIKTMAQAYSLTAH